MLCTVSILVSVMARLRCGSLLNPDARTRPDGPASRKLCSSACPPVPVGPRRGLGPVPDAELSEDVGHVPFDGVHADPEHRGHLGVLLAGREQRDDLRLTLAERGAGPRPAQ